jgi:tRNA pseudouridine38-40 synthase
LRIQLKRYFFHTGYNGHNYRGWQRQLKAVNIQEVIETTLSQMLKYPITAVGCGRTDAQVHASQFFFHVDIKEEWDYDILFRVNKMLPDDIAIFEIIPVEDLAHARFDATQRTYDYFIHTYKDPFLTNLSSFYLERSLNLDEMKRAVMLLCRYNDYRALCKTPSSYKTTICNVTSATLFADAYGDKIRFRISANRFLGRMIRIIVAKLLDIGRGELSVDEFENYLASGLTPKIIEPAYPQGLYLSKVIYPYLDIPTRNEFSSAVVNRENSWVPL